MKQYFFSGLLRTLGMAGGVLLVLATDVDAASWRWSTQSGRERVVIDLDAAKQEKGTARTGTTQLDVTLGAAPTGLARAGTPPALGSLVTGLAAEGSGLRLQLRDAAFGYIVSRPNAKRVVIDVFPDPLGTRWRNPGTPAPASAPSRAASALPEAPAVGATPRPTVPASPQSEAQSLADATRGTSEEEASKPAKKPEAGEKKAFDAGKKEIEPRTTMGKMAAATAKPEQVLAKGKDGSLSGRDGLELRGQTATPSPTAPQTTGQRPQSRPADTARTQRQAMPSPKLVEGDSFETTGKVVPPLPSEAKLAALTSQIEKIPTSPADGPMWPELRSAVSGRTSGSVQQPSSSGSPNLQTQPVRPAPPVAPVVPPAPASSPRGKAPSEKQVQPESSGTASRDVRKELPAVTGKLAERGKSPSPVAPPAPVVPLTPPASPSTPTPPAPRPDTPPAPVAVVASGQMPEMRGQTMASTATKAVQERQTAQVPDTSAALSKGKKTATPPAPVVPPAHVPDEAKKGSAHKAPSVVAPPVVQPPQAPSTVPHVQEGALAEYTPSGGVRGKITAALGSKPRIDLGLGTPPPKVQVAEKAVSDAQPEKPTRKGQKGQKGTVVAPVAVEPAAPLVASAPQTPAVPPLPEPAMVAATPEKPAEPLAETPVADTTRLTTGLRAQLNAHGPENWPEDTALTTEGREVAKEPTKPAAPKQPETREPLPPKAAEPAPPPVVIYVDEQGNTVPKPPDSPAMIAEAKKMLDSLQYQAALDLLAQIREHHLMPEQRENVLYMISEATNSLYRDNWMEGYEPVVVSTNEAMNYNLRSQRVPEALMRLGMINLNTGNQDEAAGYFGALKNKYALDPNVPLGYLALGKDQFKKGQYAEAVQSFQSILDEYPESRAVRDASRYMAEALFKQGHNSRALILVDFVDRRWPRLYLDDPEYLPMVGELQFQENRPDNALQTYWTYYNLIPDNPDNHKLLLRIGTIYLQKGLQKGSRDVLEELMRKYPQSTSAPIALQRLGEEGLYDGNPTLDQLFALFERPSNTSPDVYYRRILKEYPTSPEAELATLRLAAWTFWSKETAEAMGQAQKFIDDYPLSPYVPRAEDIIRRGFEREFALARDEENYERILRLWEQYPQVQAAHVEPTDDLRVALARGFMNRGKEKEGIDLLSVFLERPRDPDYGDYVYNLFLARALRNEDWNGVLELAEKVARWNLQPAVRAQLDYARAISSENLGLGDKALPIWRKLHDRDDIPLYQKAYATYFMARDAEHRRDLQAAYQLNMDTLKLFTQLEEERSDKADPERIRESLAALMDVTEVANRYAESLDWADKYAVFVPENSPDYAGLRFRVARLHRKMGDLGRWKAILDDIIKREPDSVFGRMAASELRTQEVARDLTRFTPDTK